MEKECECGECVRARRVVYRMLLDFSFEPFSDLILLRRTLGLSSYQELVEEALEALRIISEPLMAGEKIKVEYRETGVVRDVEFPFLNYRVVHKE